MLKSSLRPPTSHASIRLEAKAHIIIFLLVLAVGSVIAIPALGRDLQVVPPSAIEAQVRKFGVGKDVKITLTSGAKLRGHIASIGTNSFTITLRKSKTERSLAYSDVGLIKDPGPVFWILVGAAIAVIVIVVIH